MILGAAEFFSRPTEKISAREEDDFFSAIRQSNQTFKRTYSGRFADVNDRLIRILAGHQARIDTVLDIGMSSGVTTLELHDALTAAGYGPRITGTDLSVSAYIVELSAGCRVLVGEDGHPLQYELFGLTARPWRRKLDLLNGMWLAKPAMHQALGRRATEKFLKDGKAAHRRVELVSPRLRRRSEIEVLEDNVLVRRPELEGRFDLVRAANILIRSYFEEDDLGRALGNVTSYLKGPGSWLLLARTLGDRSQHGTLFQVSADGSSLAVMDRLGEGSEVEELATAAFEKSRSRAMT